MAYPALDSFAKKLDGILDHSGRCYNFDCASPEYKSSGYCLPLNWAWKWTKKSRKLIPERRCGCCYVLDNKKQQIQSLHENAVFLLDFIQGFPREARNLEARFTNAARQGESTFHNLPFSIPDDNELEAVLREFDCILQEATQIKKRSQSLACASLSSKLPPKVRDALVGFEREVIEIKGRLCGEPSQLQTIPIVGMGGIGKTTLARYAYDDPSTTHHFDVHAWVTVSQNSSSTIVLSSVLSCIDPSSKEKYKGMEKESLVQHGHRYLKNRRYLIVMDDMWDTNVWDDVRRAFPDDCNGSRVVITTRSLDVASYVASSTQHYMIQLMSTDQSWRLLKEKVFGQENCPHQLERIGKIIAEKCRGLPLAIVVIAGVLSKLNQMQDSWEKIASNVSDSVNTSTNEHFYDIMSLSYTRLPHHLRPCFLYMGCFPEDYEINVSKLISLWGAEGFLIPNETEDIEELGYEYLEDLVNRNLVLIDKKRYDGKIRTVKIHDLLRDLSLRTSREENFLCTITKLSGFAQGIENSKRLSILCKISGVIPHMESSPIHTVLLFQHWGFDSWIKFRLLRVLDGLSVHIFFSRSVRDIGELIHLRYLALTCEAMGSTLRLVTESVYKLLNLQTLVVRVIPRTRESFISLESTLDMSDLYKTHVNVELWRMPQLRLLVLIDGFLQDPSTETFQVSVSSLVNLHTLSRIKDFKCSERMLEMIPNLKKLGIIYSYESTYETGWSEYGLNNLVHLQRLEKLNLYAEPYPNLKNDLSHSIAFPVTLKKLSLSGCSFPWEDMRMIGSLPNLQVLKLKRRACYGTEWETTEGEFCQLKVLLIDSTDLNQWIIESSSFPVLERLTLYECNSLREIPNDIGDIPTLELIEVDVRNLSVVESAKCIEEEQRSVGNDQLQIRVLKSRSWPIITSQ